jgi:hypothetical protein
MEWLDARTNYVSWLDDRKPGNNQKKSPVCTQKTCFWKTGFSHRGGIEICVRATGHVIRNIPVLRMFPGTGISMKSPYTKKE